MKPTITFTRDTKNITKPAYLRNSVVFIYAPKKLKIFLMQFERNYSYFTKKLTQIFYFKI